MSDFGSFRYGGSSYPLTASTANSLLQDSDPVVYHGLQYFAGVLGIHIGARLVAECTAANVTANGLPITSAVMRMVPMDPLPWLLEEQFQFPLLALYRISERISRRTINWSHDTAKLGIAYVLPPLTAGQAERIIPILTSVPRVIANRTEQGYDPAYLNGAKVWSAAFAGLEDIDFPQGQFGSFPGLDNLMFPAWWGEITVNERQMREADFGRLAGVDVAMDLPTPGDATLPDFTDFKSDIAKRGPATG